MRGADDSGSAGDDDRSRPASRPSLESSHSAGTTASAVCLLSPRARPSSPSASPSSSSSSSPSGSRGPKGLDGKGQQGVGLGPGRIPSRSPRPPPLERPAAVLAAAPTAQPQRKFLAASAAHEARMAPKGTMQPMEIDGRSIGGGPKKKGSFDFRRFLTGMPGMQSMQSSKRELPELRRPSCSTMQPGARRPSCSTMLPGAEEGPLPSNERDIEMALEAQCDVAMWAPGSRISRTAEDNALRMAEIDADIAAWDAEMAEDWLQSRDPGGWSESSHDDAPEKSDAGRPRSSRGRRDRSQSPDAPSRRRTELREASRSRRERRSDEDPPRRRTERSASPRSSGSKDQVDLRTRIAEKIRRMSREKRREDRAHSDQSSRGRSKSRDRGRKSKKKKKKEKRAGSSSDESSEGSSKASVASKAPSNVANQRRRLMIYLLGAAGCIMVLLFVWIIAAIANGQSSSAIPGVPAKPGQKPGNPQTASTSVEEDGNLEIETSTDDLRPMTTVKKHSQTPRHDRDRRNRMAVSDNLDEEKKKTRERAQTLFNRSPTRFDFPPAASSGFTGQAPRGTPALTKPGVTQGIQFQQVDKKLGEGSVGDNVEKDQHQGVIDIEVQSEDIKDDEPATQGTQDTRAASPLRNPPAVQSDPRLKECTDKTEIKCTPTKIFLTTAQECAKLPGFCKSNVCMCKKQANKKMCSFENQCLPEEAYKQKIADLKRQQGQQPAQKNGAFGRKKSNDKAEEEIKKHRARMEKAQQDKKTGGGWKH